MNPEIASRLANAEQAKAAMERWLGPAFDVIEQSYANRIVELAGTTPWDDKRIVKVAMALRILRETKAQITAVIADGGLARHDASHAKQIEAIPVEKRRMLGLGGG